MREKEREGLLTPSIHLSIHPSIHSTVLLPKPTDSSVDVVAVLLGQHSR